MAQLVQRKGSLPFSELSQLLDESKQSSNVKWGLGKKEYHTTLKALYEVILNQYPLLTSTWIEYAEFVYKSEGSAKVDAVYELAFGYLPRNYDIWMSWCQFKLETTTCDKKMIEHLERARIAIGDNYFAWDFYHSYLNYLKKLHDKKTEDDASILFYQLLRLVIQLPLYDYLKAYEYNNSIFEATDSSSIHHFINEKDLKDQFKFGFFEIIKDASKFKKVKMSLKKRFTELYIVVQYASWKRFPYEKHLITLEYDPDAQLTRLELNKWREYLEYSEVMGLKVGFKDSEIDVRDNNKDWTDVLYNRCLSICGNYHYFWIKWSNYHLNFNDFDRAKQILMRGLSSVPHLANTPEWITVRIRLIDLFLLEGELEKALKLCLDVQKEDHIVIPISVKVLEILCQGKSGTSIDYIEKLMSKIPKNSKLQFLREVCEFNQFKEYIDPLLDRMDLSEKEKDTLFRQTGISRVLPTTPTPSGWKCEYF